MIFRTIHQYVSSQVHFGVLLPSKYIQLPVETTPMPLRQILGSTAHDFRTSESKWTESLPMILLLLSLLVSSLLLAQDNTRLYEAEALFYDSYYKEAKEAYRTYCSSLANKKRNKDYYRYLAKASYVAFSELPRTIDKQLSILSSLQELAKKNLSSKKDEASIYLRYLEQLMRYRSLMDNPVSSYGRLQTIKEEAQAYPMTPIEDLVRIEQLLAEIAAILGKSDALEQHLSTAAALTHSIDRTLPKLNLFYQRAQILSQSGQIPDAIKVLERSLDMIEESSLPPVLLGICAQQFHYFYARLIALDQKHELYYNPQKPLEQFLQHPKYQASLTPQIRAATHLEIAGKYLQRRFTLMADVHLDTVLQIFDGLPKPGQPDLYELRALIEKKVLTGYSQPGPQVLTELQELIAVADQKARHTQDLDYLLGSTAYYLSFSGNWDLLNEVELLFLRRMIYEGSNPTRQITIISNLFNRSNQLHNLSILQSALSYRDQVLEGIRQDKDKLFSNALFALLDLKIRLSTKSHTQTTTYPEIYATIDNLLEKYPNEGSNMGLLTELIRLLFSAGELQRSQDYLKQAKELKEQTTGPERNYWDSWYLQQEGLLELQLGGEKTTKAVEKIKEGIQGVKMQQPCHVSALVPSFVLIDYWSNHGQFEEASAYLNELKRCAYPGIAINLLEKEIIIGLGMGKSQSDLSQLIRNQFSKTQPQPPSIKRFTEISSLYFVAARIGNQKLFDELRQAAKQTMEYLTLHQLIQEEDLKYMMNLDQEAQKMISSFFIPLDNYEAYHQYVNLTKNYRASNDLIYFDSEQQELASIVEELKKNNGADNPLLVDPILSLGESYLRSMTIHPKYNARDSFLYEKATKLFEEAHQLAITTLGPNHRFSLLSKARLLGISIEADSFSSVQEQLEVLLEHPSTKLDPLLPLIIHQAQLNHLWSSDRPFKEYINYFDSLEPHFLASYEKTILAVGNTSKYLVSSIYAQLSFMNFMLGDFAAAGIACEKAIYYQTGRKIEELSGSLTELRPEDYSQLNPIVRRYAQASSLILYEDHISTFLERFTKGRVSLADLDMSTYTGQLEFQRRMFNYFSDDELAEIEANFERWKGELDEEIKKSLAAHRLAMQVGRLVRRRLSVEKRLIFDNQNQEDKIQYLTLANLSSMIAGQSQALEDAFLFIEAGRGATVMEEQALKQILLQDKTIHDIQQQIVRLETSIQQNSLKTKEEYNQVLLQINEAKSTLNILTSEKFPNYNELVYNQRISLAGIQELLPDETLVISYHLAFPLQLDDAQALELAHSFGKNALEKTGIGFTMDKEEVRLFSVSSTKEFFHRIDSVQQSINPKVDFRKNSHELFHDLLVPAFQANFGKTYKHIIFIPDAFLSGLPFELLLTKPEQKETPWSELSYLIRDYNITYAYSLGVLYRQLSTRSQQKLASNPSLLALAPIQFNDPNLPTLSQTDRMVEAMKSWNDKHLSIETLTGPSANKMALEKALSTGHDYLLLATHGEVNPREHYIALAGESDASKLKLEDIYKLSLNNELSFLLGCRTNRGWLNRAEGIIGFVRAFLIAGSKNVIASQQVIQEGASVPLAQAFFEKLAKRKKKRQSLSETLREVKLMMIEGEVKAPNGLPLERPYYWSNLIFFGL